MTRQFKIAGCLLAWLVAAGLLNFLEPHALAGLFRARHALHGIRPVDARIRLIVLDEASYGKLRKPFELWSAELAEVVEALTRAQASVVGIDVTLNPPRAGLDPAHPLVGLLDDGQRALVQAMGPARVVLSEQFQLPDGGLPMLGADPTVRQSSPALAAAAKAVADDALLADPDGVLRRLPPASSFAGRLAELLTGQPVTANGLINYPGPPGSLPEDTFSEVLERIRGENPLFEFKETACLIVADGWAFRNLVTTPFGPTPTGDVQAAALNTMLLNEPIRRAPLVVWLLPTLAFALAGGLGRVRWTLLAGALYAAAALELFTFTGWWLPLWSPFGAALLARGLIVAGSRRNLKGTRQRLTMLHSLLDGFSAATPQATIALLEDYVEDMDGIAARHGGILTRLAGDELLVLFESPDQALRAGLAMLEHVDGLEEFSRLSLAVHTGEVITGDVSSRRTVLGQEVERTLQIGQESRTCRVRLLVSAATREEATLNLRWQACGGGLFSVEKAVAPVVEPQPEPPAVEPQPEPPAVEPQPEPPAVEPQPARPRPARVLPPKTPRSKATRATQAPAEPPPQAAPEAPTTARPRAKPPKAPSQKKPRRKR